VRIPAAIDATFGPIIGTVADFTVPNATFMIADADLNAAEAALKKFHVFGRQVTFGDFMVSVPASEADAAARALDAAGVAYSRQENLLAQAGKATGLIKPKNTGKRMKKTSRKIGRALGL
jgi:hypothetical protein